MIVFKIGVVVAVYFFALIILLLFSDYRFTWESTAVVLVPTILIAIFDPLSIFN